MSKICNTKVPVSDGIELNDKDYCVCLLSKLKDIEKNYVIAMTEASNEWLYSIYKDSFIEIADMQRELYLLMFRKGWYVLEKSDSNEAKNGAFVGLSGVNIDLA